MRTSLYAKLDTFVFMSVCLINVYSLKVTTTASTTTSIKTFNPMGMTGKPLIEFVNGLHIGYEFFDNPAGAKWIFDKVADDGKFMTHKGMKNFLNRCAGRMGGGGVPKWVVERFYGESEKNLKGQISFEAFKKEMLFAMGRDIEEFTKDVLKEQPDWHYIKLRN